LPPDTCLNELESLVLAARGRVVARIIQRRGQGTTGIDPATFIGSGKVGTVAETVAEHEAGLVVFDNPLSPAQIRELEKRVGCRVIDRSELILDIFARRARTRVSKLQVELAQLEYTAPRLRGMWSHLARQAGGGVATRGPGEKQLEIDRRLVDQRITRLKGELSKISDRRERQVTGRNVWSVGLVGYTNAGKSTLLNALTGAETYTADALFATLDTVSRRWAVRPGVDIPLSDTVGFVRDLPHHLVASFKSTLAEALHADLLLHVVDASHPEADQQIDAVHDVLGSLDVPKNRILGVLNKVDLSDRDRLEMALLKGRFDEVVTLSAHTGVGLDELANRVVARRASAWTEFDVDVPHDVGRLAALVNEHGEVLSEMWDDDGWHARISVPKSVVWQLKAFKRRRVRAPL
jgi:GTP-binding protein HflX